MAKRGGKPEREQYTVADNDANAPHGKQVDIPVPRVRRLALEAAQEGVIHHSGRPVRQYRADVQ